MEDKHVKELKDHVTEVIKLTVNGKIDRLTYDFADWKEVEAEKREAIDRKLDEYIAKTTEYMDSTKPMVEFFQNTTGFRKVTKWLFGFLVTVGGAYLLFKEIIQR